MKKILITGASGFIGSQLCKFLSADNIVMGIYNNHKPDKSINIEIEKVDLTDHESVKRIICKFIPDVVIHCAAIAHQKIGKIKRDTYYKVNSEAAVKLADIAFNENSEVLFIYLSSVSIYGESKLNIPVSEEHVFNPSSDYGKSKLDGEKYLQLFADKKGMQLLILRLAPVYDKEWSFNIDRRVLLPKNIAYIQFGSGHQKMSALARQNLVDFVAFIIKKSEKKETSIVNICDMEPYDFSTILGIYKKSHKKPNRPVVTVPLFIVYLGTRLGGLIFFKYKKWIYGCYEKVGGSLVYDSSKMNDMGFYPKHSMYSVL